MPKGIRKKARLADNARFWMKAELDVGRGIKSRLDDKIEFHSEVYATYCRRAAVIVA